MKIRRGLPRCVPVVHPVKFGDSIMSKIYTKTGDKGQTSLLSGERVDKSHARVEAYGTVDELNAALGVVASAFEAEGNSKLESVFFIQSCLFRIGSWLASSPGSDILTRLGDVGPGEIGKLESGIDQMQSEMPPLTSFILPGGDKTSAQVHVARTICRRAERRLVALIQNCVNEQEPDTLTDVLQFINRLADYLFVLARYVNFQKGIKDRIWEK